MIEEIEFQNFRNLNGKYSLNQKLNVIFGKNNSGKTNLLEGIRLAFSLITNEYFKVRKSDFYNSDDSNPITIKVKLSSNDIPSLNYFDSEGKKCGFTLIVRKTQTGKYIKVIKLYNDADVDYEILREEEKIPNIYMIPLVRIDDLYSDWLSVGISKFIESEDKYSALMVESKERIKSSMISKVDLFKKFCEKFNQNFDIELTEPKITDEKVYIVNGDKEHNYSIGSGYKSIANIILNTMDEKHNIILIDEIENHLHPALLRNLLREIKQFNDNVQIIATTHSPIVINELMNEELIDISGAKLTNLSDLNKRKISKFLHPGRCEIIFGDNIVLVEGITEELLLKNYITQRQKNWTIVNVAGIMFEPYIELAVLLNKKIIVISDTDILLSEQLTPTERYKNLEKYCNDRNIKLISTYNTLESDLYREGLIPNEVCCLLEESSHNEIFVAKNGKKTVIAEKLIDSNVDLSNWHIIQEIENEFNSN